MERDEFFKAQSRLNNDSIKRNPWVYDSCNSNVVS